MQSARWERVDELFAAALAVPPPQRSEYVARACGADAELRNEVESLLDHHRDDGFLDTPGPEWAPAVVPRAGARPAMGQRLGRFTILGKLGAGGMGEVYLARDPLLQRRVALKLLPAELADDAEWARRFRHEALAASALNHPNLLTVHEVAETDGSEMLVSEVVDGESLRERMAQGPLPLRPALELVLQLCRGLGAAHAAGLVHRDVKPENVMVRRDGLVKLLDFGIAESPHHTAPGDGERSPAAGRSGTLAYMSPEQAAGLPSDARSDVWSVGVLLHELLTGERPPSPPDAGRPLDIAPTRRQRLPNAVTALIRRVLAPDAEQRPQDAAELANEIERLLAQRAGVAGWSLAQRALAAAGVVAVLTIVVASIVMRDPGGPASARTTRAPRPAPDPAAYALYQRGRALWGQRTHASISAAVVCFEQATARDPRFAEAFAALADARLMLAGMGEDPHRQRQLAHTAIEKALGLDDTLGQAHTALAMEAQNYEYDWERAEKEYRRAIALSPRDPTAWHRLGELLALLGRFDEGIALLERARRLDPDSPIIGTDEAKALWFARRYDEAERAARRVLDRWPDFAQAQLFRAASLAYLGRRAEARAELDRFLASEPVLAARTIAASVYAAAGDGARAQALLAETLAASERGENVDAYAIAATLVALGRRDEAMQWLERAYREGTILLGVSVHPAFGPLRSEPRFRALCARLRLQPAAAP